jgi:hypothetical protein
MIFRCMANMPERSSFSLRRHPGILTLLPIQTGISIRYGINSKFPANPLKFYPT